LFPKNFHAFYKLFNPGCGKWKTASSRLNPDIPFSLRRLILFIRWMTEPRAGVCKDFG
jgi:hypothetical protein